MTEKLDLGDDGLVAWTRHGLIITEGSNVVFLIPEEAKELAVFLRGLLLKPEE